MNSAGPAAMPKQMGARRSSGGWRPFLGGLLSSIADRGRAILRGGAAVPAQLQLTHNPALIDLCRVLLERRGEASRVALATQILLGWRDLDEAGRRDFLVALAEGFGPDQARLDRAVDAYRLDPSPPVLTELHAAAEPVRQELLRRLNLAPLGTEALVRMREEGFRHLARFPALASLDADFVHLFSSWFNRGFLVLRQIDWTTPANILEKIIRYEAVHEIRDWDDLRRRLQPADRRCFAFFHPQLIDEPLIFVEVALASGIPDGIAALLVEDRIALAADRVDTAVFYSISNCQKGLRGISFGDFLIKQVVEELRRELAALTTFVTLSPVPGFAAWLAQQPAETPSGEAANALPRPVPPGWRPADEHREALLAAAARYLVTAKTKSGLPVDPVARFHLGNGARLHRLNFLGDISPRGLKEAHGLMVNYLYKLDEIETNHERFAGAGEVVASPQVKTWLASGETAPPARHKTSSKTRN